MSLWDGMGQDGTRSNSHGTAWDGRKRKYSVGLLTQKVWDSLPGQSGEHSAGTQPIKSIPHKQTIFGTGGITSTGLAVSHNKVRVRRHSTLCYLLAHSNHSNSHQVLKNFLWQAMSKSSSSSSSKATGFTYALSEASGLDAIRAIPQARKEGRPLSGTELSALHALLGKFLASANNRTAPLKDELFEVVTSHGKITYLRYFTILAT